MSLVNLKIKNYYKDIIQKEKRRKLLSSFHSINSSINDRKVNKKKFNIINHEILKSFQNNEIKKTFSNYYNISTKEGKTTETPTKKYYTLTHNDTETSINSNNDKSIFLISQKEKEKLILLNEEKKRIESAKNNKKFKTIKYNTESNIHENRLNRKIKNKTFQTQPDYYFPSLLLDKYKNNEIKKELELINNPDSIVSMIYDTLKNLEKESKNYPGRIIYKDKIKHVNEIKIIQAPVLKQLFKLQKEIKPNDNRKISYKSINTNYFMNLKIKFH